MKEGYNPVEQMNKNGNYVPSIYVAIETGDPTKIVEQLFKDFYAIPRDNELICLAFESLVRQGVNGAGAFDFIASDSGELGDIARLIKKESVNGKPISPERLESIFRIKRFEKVVNPPHNFENSLDFEEAYQLACERRLIDDQMGLQEFIDKYYAACINHDLPPQMTGEIDKELLSVASTFGANEPAYLEMLGPQELLRLRTMTDPKFLLLGTLGVYSAREFARYGRKLNNTSIANVIDIDPRHVNAATSYIGENGLRVEVGSALNMPINTGVTDHVYTNFLFHALWDGSQNNPNRQNLSKLFRESFRVLKPGGSFCIVERQYGAFKGRDMSEARREIVSIALQAGFSSEFVEPKDTYEYLFRKEIGTAKISDNGFPRYNAVLNKMSENNVALRFKK